GSHTLQGAPMGTYSKPSGPNAMYFHPCQVRSGNLSFTTTAEGGLSSCVSMSDNFNMRLISATYSAPSLNATPFGEFSPEASTHRLSAIPSPSSSFTAYTLSA